MAAEPAGPALRPEPASFRDRESRVLHGSDGVYRALSAEAAEDWAALAGSDLFARFSESGRLVHTEQVEPRSRPALLGGDEPAALLRHERVPFVSYPYEWTFGMLQDAALLQLELLSAAIDEGLMIKDASPYNVQWRGTSPVFIDIGSFERLREGEPWIGYRQFCMLFYYPLLLQALTGAPFQPWLRGSLEGITPAQMRGVLGLRRVLKRGVFSHVWLHDRMERRARAATAADATRELRSAGFKSELIKANVERLRSFVGRLEWEPESAGWIDYGETHSYAEAEVESKGGFVASAARELAPALTWDLGCNDGRFARIAAEHSDHVVAVDSDQPTVERLYRELRAEGNEKVLPLVMNLADPSPSLGWGGAERTRLEQRGRPGLVLALAIVHHISISAHVPLPEVVAWLRGFDAPVVVEFPDRKDPMVQRLLAGKREGSHPDYERDLFERELERAFDVRGRETLASGTRTLYFARPRGA